MYCGKIFIPKYKEEESFHVQGQHEPLITEALFYKVQDVLDGRGKVMRTKVAVDPDYPLRGYLLCPDCGKVLTASASKGRTQHYYYYHCRLSCKFRLKAQETNDIIAEEIMSYAKPLPFLELYKEVIVAAFNNRTKEQRSESQQIKLQLEQVNARVIKARDLLLDAKLDPDDFRIIKNEAAEITNRLELKLNECAKTKFNIDPLLDSAIANISKLDELYVNGDVAQKKENYWFDLP